MELNQLAKQLASPQQVMQDRLATGNAQLGGVLAESFGQPAVMPFFLAVGSELLCLVCVVSLWEGRWWETVGFWAIFDVFCHSNVGV